MTRLPLRQWTCFCGTSIDNTPMLVKTHQAVCAVYKNKPTLVSKANAEAWLKECRSSCQEQVIDALMSAQVQARLSKLGVRHELHVHGGPKAPFILLRMLYPINDYFITDAAVDAGMNWNAVFKEAEELVAIRKQHAKFYWGIE